VVKCIFKLKIFLFVLRSQIYKWDWHLDDRVQWQLGAELHLGIGPPWNLDDHVDQALGLIDPAINYYF
jgi:hypothetical protein